MTTAPNNPVLTSVIPLAPVRQPCQNHAMKLVRPIAFTCILTLLLGTCLVPAQPARTNSSAPSNASVKSSSKQSAVKATPAPPTGTFDDFKSIPDRNIFNTRRYAGRAANPDTQPPPPPRRDPVIESFSLLGTMEYEKGSVAFFEGSNSSLRRSAKVDDSIAGCKITAIETSVITLETDGKPMQLRVGYMLRREDQGQWQTREAERPYESAFSSSFSSGFSSGTNSNSLFGGFSFGSRDSRSSSFFSRDSRSSSSFGGGNPSEIAQSRIRDQDRNGDGRVSREEADSRLRDRFREIDRDGDGFVTGDEYTAYYTARFGGGSGTPSPTGSSFNNSASPGTFSSGSSANNSSSGGSPSNSTSSSSGESDLLRRLMEQRARENR